MTRTAIVAKHLAFIICLLLAIIAVLVSGCSGQKPTPATGPASLSSNVTGNVSVHFINVGQGDSILVRAGDHAMLVDGGKRDAGPTVVSYLQEQGVNSIDLLVSTHPHADHIGGLLAVLNAFPVKRVLDSGQAHPSQTYENYLTLIDRLNIPYTVAESGQTYDLGGVQVLVLEPSISGQQANVNENSIVLKVVDHNVSFLLMGDAGVPEEKGLKASGYDLKSDVLKVGHHGSRYASSISFLSQVKPAVSVIEVGQNKYGHPAPQTLARLQDIGSIVYRTDVNGNIVVYSNGTLYNVKAQYPSGVTAGDNVPQAMAGGA